jgi:hypothetical protein
MPEKTACPALLPLRSDDTRRPCGRPFRRAPEDIATAERRCGACRRNGWPAAEGEPAEGEAGAEVAA